MITASRDAILILILASSTCLFGSQITIEDGGYTGIVVAFAPDIDKSEGYSLIPKIQDLFRRGSVALFNASQGRAYFRHVTLLVPESWEAKDGYQRATFENFGVADVRIDDPNPMFGDRPYSLQATPCGYPEKYIHLTPQYLNDLESRPDAIFSDPGKALAYEWAHFRYGVFDEFATIDDADQCPQEASEEAISISTNETCQDSDNCRFKTSLNNETDTNEASQIESQYLICDGTECPYDRQAKTKQNLLCHNRNAWSIITSHKDFQKPVTNVTNIEPQFTIVQQLENTFSLVLDVSGSMSTLSSEYSRLFMVRDVLRRWLMEDVKNGTAVGIVQFSSEVHFRGPFRTITNDDVRRQLAEELPIRTYSSTCIGCGLLAGMEQLKEYRGRAGGDIILLTDGEENEAPYIVDVVPQLVSDKVRVVTIAFTKDAAPALMNLSLATGGKAYFVGEGDLVGLDNSFEDAISYQTADLDLAVKVMDNAYENNEESISGSFTIDDTIGNNTSVNVQYLDDGVIREVRIVGPNVNVSSNQNASEVETETKNIKFNFQSLETGTYEYLISKDNKSVEKVTVSVKSRARSKDIKPISVRSWTSEVAYDNTSAFLIFAEVTQGTKPVIDANVSATVERPNKAPEVVQLFDNGIVADITRNDGIYSRYFLYNGKGKYSVKVHVLSDGEAYIEEADFSQNQSEFSNETHKSAGRFERSVTGGALEQSEDVDADVTDIYPPNKIQDLTAIHCNDHNYTVELKWTAPGDDIDYRKASRYEMRYSASWDQLFDHFEDCVRINLNMTPSEARETETISIYAPDSCNLKKQRTFYFAIKTFDDQNRGSRISNIVDVTFDPVPETTTESPTESLTLAPTVSDLSEYLNKDDESIQFLQVEKLTYMRIPGHHGRANYSSYSN